MEKSKNQNLVTSHLYTVPLEIHCSMYYCITYNTVIECALEGLFHAKSTLLTCVKRGFMTLNFLRDILADQNNSIKSKIKP